MKTLQTRAAACILLLLVAGCTRPQKTPPTPVSASPTQSGANNNAVALNPVADIDASLDAATRYLLANQSEDGAWRSKKYGLLREGPSLTPTVLYSLSL